MCARKEKDICILCILCTDIPHNKRLSAVKSTYELLSAQCQSSWLSRWAFRIDIVGDLRMATQNVIMLTVDSQYSNCGGFRKWRIWYRTAPTWALPHTAYSHNVLYIYIVLRHSILTRFFINIILIIIGDFISNH